MIEDLIEGIACYCDNDYQVNALNNMYSTLYPNQRSFGFFGNLAGKVKGVFGKGKGNKKKNELMVIPSDSEFANDKPSSSSSNVPKGLMLLPNEKPNQGTPHDLMVIPNSVTPEVSKDIIKEKTVKSKKKRVKAIKENIESNKINELTNNLDILKHSEDSSKKGFDKVKNAAKNYKNQSNDLKKSLHNWKVGAVVGGGLAGAAALGLGAYALYKHNKKKKEAEKAAELASKI